MTISKIACQGALSRFYLWDITYPPNDWETVYRIVGNPGYKVHPSIINTSTDKSRLNRAFVIYLVKRIVR